MLFRVFRLGAAEADVEGSGARLVGSAESAGRSALPSLEDLRRREDLRRDESRGTCCGEVLADEPDADPALDITAAAALLPPRFGNSVGGAISDSAPAAGGKETLEALPR